MSKQLVLAEKPSVGRDIAKVLGCNQKKNGYFEGSKYIVTWALGHLVTLATPDMYDKKYETWRMEDLPMLPSPLKTIVIGKTKKQFNTVTAQMKRQDVNTIIIATDAGREGELVARWIIDKARLKKPLKRLWISSVTDKAIKDGFNKLQAGQKYEPLYDAAVARSEADWYVGLNATRALTTKFNAQLSAGRVQTPTLGIVAHREAEIKNFRPQKYYEIEFKTKDGITFKWRNQKGQTRLSQREKAEDITRAIKGQQAEIKTVDMTKKKQFAPQLYDLTELQGEANKIYGFSGKQTLRAMQNLYERYKVLTYPRTDSRVITTDIVPTLNERLKAVQFGDYAKIALQLQGKKFKLPKSVVNDHAVGDHHAIIPTEEAVDYAALDNTEQKIYDLVVKRFLAVLSDPHEYEETAIRAEVAGEIFTAKAAIVLKQGWKAVYGDQKNAEQSSYRKGQTLTISPKIKAGETTPPPHLTEGALLKAMENPLKYMDEKNKKVQETLQAVGGIGTVATRADIIDKLVNGQYIEIRGKSVYLTSTGKQLLDLVPEDLRSPALTAEWEEKLLQIEKGKLKKTAFIAEIKQYAKTITHEIKNMDETFKHDNLTGSKCPKCGDLMLEIENRHGKMLRCKNRSCNHKKNIYKLTNARCPNCKKKLKLYGEGEGQTFRCVCGHSEKLDAFQKRKKKTQNTRVSKKEMNKYMKKQDDFSNNALADQLAKLKDLK